VRLECGDCTGIVSPETGGKYRICVPSAAEARQVLETTGYKGKEIWQTGSPETDGCADAAKRIIEKMKEDGLI
jgi:hypothetical protein